MGCSSSVPTSERGGRTHRQSKCVAGRDRKRGEEANTTTTAATPTDGEGITPRGTAYKKISLEERRGSGLEQQHPSLETSVLTTPGGVPVIGSSGSISTCATLVHALCLAPGCVPSADSSLKMTEGAHREFLEATCAAPNPALIRSFGVRWNHDPTSLDPEGYGNNLGERPEDLSWERVSDGSSSAGSAANESSPFVASVKLAVRCAVARAKASGHEYVFEEGPMAAVLVRTRSSVSPEVNRELEVQKTKSCDRGLAGRVMAWRYQVHALISERDELTDM